MDEIIKSISLALHQQRESSDFKSEFQYLPEDDDDSNKYEERGLQEPGIQRSKMSVSEDGLRWSGILNLISG